MGYLTPDSDLPKAPLLEDIPIHEDSRAFLRAYAKRSTPWNGLGIVVGSDPVLVNDTFYAVLRDMCRDEMRIRVADHVASYTLPQPPDNYPHVKRENIKTAMDMLELASYQSSALVCVLENGQTYTDLLKSFSRWDPDVMGSGSLTEEGIVELCISLALTGHRVLIRAEMTTVSDILKYLGKTKERAYLLEVFDFISLVSREKNELIASRSQLEALLTT